MLANTCILLLLSSCHSLCDLEVYDNMAVPHTHTHTHTHTQVTSFREEGPDHSEKQVWEKRMDSEMDIEYPRDRDMERDRDYKRDSHKPEGGRGEPHMPDGSQRQMHHGHYPPYPPYPYPPYDPYRYPMYPPPHGPYPMHHGGYPPPSQRYGHPRGTKRGPTEKDEAYGRHDFHPWQSQDMEHRLKQRWSGEERMEERPRILSKTDGSRRDSQKKDFEGKDEPEREREREKSSALKRTDSASPDAQEGGSKHRVTFADETSQSPVDDQPVQVTSPPMRGHQSKKILLRKMGDSDTSLEKLEQHPPPKGHKDRPRDLKPLQQGDSGGDSPDSKTPDADVKVRQMAWSMNERGPITSPKTLYEPDGRKSEAMFKRYKRERDGPSGKGEGGEKGGRSTPTSGTPSDVKMLAKEDGDQEVGEEEVTERRTQTISPTSSEREPGRGPERRERRGPPDKLRKQDSGRQLHEKDRQDSRDSRERPKYRRDDSGRERGAFRKGSSSGEVEHPESSSRDRERERPDRRHDSATREYDSGKGGYQAHEYGRGGREPRRDRERADHRRVESRDDERREPGRQRREHPDDSKPPRDRKDREPQERSGRPERHPSRTEPPKHEGRQRREDRRPRERQDRYDRPEDINQWGAPPEMLPEATAASEHVSYASEDQVSKSENPPVCVGQGGVSENDYRTHPQSENWPSDSTEQRLERKRSRESRREDYGRPERPAGRGDRARGGQPARRGPPGERERDRGGRYPPRDKEKGERERDRGGRPYAKPQPPRESLISEQYEGEGWETEERKPPRRPDHPERGNRSRERQPPQPRRAPPRGPERGQPRKGREEGDRRVGASEWQKGTAKPALGYQDLEAVSSSSDWEQEVEGVPVTGQQDSQLDHREDHRHKPEERRPPRRAERREDVSAGRSYNQGERGPRTEGGPQKRHSREERREKDDQHREQTTREFRRGVGRGRGRTDDVRREKRGAESTRPGSYSSQRRQGGGNNREGRTDSRQTEKHTVFDNSEPSTTASYESRDSTSRSRDRTPQGDKRTDLGPHKASDFEKYDLNSHKVAIVDDIGSETAEGGRLSPSVQAEFVEVTSKKTQKEKHRREKEEKRRLDEEKRKLDEQKKPKKFTSSRPHDRASQSQAPNKPVSAWSTDNTSQNIWSASSGGSDWLSAPGSQANVDSGWVSNTSPNVGVIGDNLQTKQTQASSGSSSLIPQPVSIYDSSYSLFPSILTSPLLGGPAIVTTATGSMLNAAIDSTLSQEALVGVSNEDPLVTPKIIENNESVPIPVGEEGTGKDNDGLEFQKVERRNKGKNLPPRFQQSSKDQQQQPPHYSGPGRGRGSAVRHSEQKRENKTVGGKSEKVRSKFRLVGSKSIILLCSYHFPPLSLSLSLSLSRTHTQTSTEQRYYVPPPARGDHPRAQKPGGNERRQPHPQRSKPPSKSQPQQNSESTKQTKVA